MVERCGDRQLKFDGLQKWPFHFFVESLPVMLQISLLLLACGVCRYMAPINTLVACTLIALTGLGVLFYVGIVIAGASSYECPFQTPASVPLRASWTKIAPRFIAIVLPTLTAFRTLREIVQSHTPVFLSSLTGIRRHFHGPLDRIRLGASRLRLSWTGFSTRRLSHDPPLPTAQGVPTVPNPQEIVPWFSLDELTVDRMRNNNDARCVSWVLRNITDAEALDAAIRLAGTIRWFEDGIDTEPPYDLIVSTFHTCFGSDGVVYSGSRDRAYYSGQAILWIHTLAVCKSEEFARTFPLPTTQHAAQDPDLTHLLYVTTARSGGLCFADLLLAHRGVTPSHLQWVSNLLLHLSWAAQDTLHFNINDWACFTNNPDIPMRAVLNCVLTCCNLLGSPVGEDVLRIEDKSCGIPCLCSPGFSFSHSTVTALNRS